MTTPESAGLLAERQQINDRLEALALEILGVRSMLDRQFSRITSSAQLDLLPPAQEPATSSRRQPHHGHGRSHIQGGAEAFLAKPCLPDNLVREIRGALQRPPGEIAPAQRARRELKASGTAVRNARTGSAQNWRAGSAEAGRHEASGDGKGVTVYTVASAGTGTRGKSTVKTHPLSGRLRA